MAAVNLTTPVLLLLPTVIAFAELAITPLMFSVVPVVASGGISNLSDIADLAALTSIGIEGAIVGKALYAGAFTLGEALKVASK